MKKRHERGIIDPTEAPEGYYAVLKSDVMREGLGNICRACDWRPECQKKETAITLHNHRCVDYVVVCADGREVQRNDGCSVVFKRLSEAQPAEHRDTDLFPSS
ncbi:MAG: hypothetical protein WC291_00505 [Thermodesulfovibrionales bacterium]|jgi:hypothetical protein